ncbi:hypothetical protein [Aurantiacibacter zhengii]|uniref:Phage shock protein B n=1 Tax=Aurantiacibacter zhengii TaxID=2307003 RepID=A0A418NV30_9SPHN|nr:hypothetical protein [Aurantiacibacter zhengii]RIV87785.1 hypothetical protein D2V07_05505 [Aurantiacibacter zhengii]
MDGDLILIFGFILSLLLVILPFAYIVNKRVNEHEERKLEIKARIEEAKAQQAMNGRQLSDDMEDRMRVLERIVTDPGADLSRQIEELRADRSAREERIS